MDRSLREMGVGDLSVPKRMKRMAEAYYGRAAPTMPRSPRGIARRSPPRVRRNLLRGAAGAAEEIAAYAAEAAGRLESLSVTDLREGRLRLARSGRHPREEPGMSDTLPFSRPIDVSAIPATGVDRTIKAEAAERAAIAEQYGIPEVRSLAAEFVVGRRRAA